MSRIFLSHSSQDNFEAIALLGWLASEGWDDVFLDLDPERGIAAGERWERRLHEAASRCEAVIFLVSGHWLASGWCWKEYSLARGLNKQLFAVIVDPTKALEDLPAELKGTWQAVNLTAGQDLQLFAARMTGSVEERHIGYSLDGLKRLKHGLDKAGLDPKFFAWPPVNDPKRPPYRGLKPLEAVDAGILFGRDAPIIEAIDRLRGLAEAAPPRLLVILGASGAGKSSFLRAGLLPRLARDDNHFRPLPVIRPERGALTGGSGLLAALESAFPGRTRAELRAAIQDGGGALQALLVEAVGAPMQGRRSEEGAARPPAVIIAIDQAEELFLAEGAQESAALLELLRQLATTDNPAVIVIFAIRSDSYDRLQHVKQLEGLGQTALPLLPMPRGAYSEVIEGPARRVEEAGGKLAIEPALTQRLLEDIDIGGGSDALPLLAFTLEQLYLEYHAANRLRLQDYEAFGGLRGAIDASVAGAFERADTDARIPKDRAAREKLLRRGFIPWLAGVDPDTKSFRRRIARRADIPAETAPLIDLLVEERLFSTDVRRDKDAAGNEVNTITIEPAHEALLRQWGLVEGWLREDFGLLATLEALQRAARDWDGNDRAEAWLAHQGPRLADALSLDTRPDIAARLDATDRAYLAGCQAREEAARAEAERRRQEKEEEQERRIADAEQIASANRRTAQRTAVGLAAALVLALASAGFGYYAWIQKNAAEQQRNRAERTVALASDTTNSLVFDLARKFQNAQGVPAATIKAILDQARQLQDQLIRAGESDPKLLDSQSVTLSAAADTLQTLGETKAALELAQRSNDILQGLLKQRPDDKTWQRNLSVSYNQIGDIQNAQGNLPEALTSYQAGLAIAEHLAQASPDDAVGQRDLAVFHNKLGDIRLARGQLSDALAAYQAGRTIVERLSKSDPGNADWQRDLAVYDSRLGHVATAQGRLSEALASYKNGVAIAERLSKANPRDTAWQYLLSTTYSEFGDVQAALGQQQQALSSYQTSLSVAQDLSRSDPTNATWQRNVVVSSNKVGDAQYAQGNLTDALAAYQASRTIAERLSRSDPNNSLWQRDLAISYNKLGDIQSTQGRLPDALASYQAYLDGIVHLAARAPDNTAYQRDLAIAYEKIGNIRLVQHDLPQALATYERGLATRQRLAQSDPSDASWQWDLSTCYNRVGDVQLAKGQAQDALISYQSGLAIIQKLGDLDPSNADWQGDLAVSYSKIGDAQITQSHTSDALAAYQSGFAILDRLTRSGSTKPNWLRNLSVLQAKIGDLKMSQGLLPEALKAYQANLAIAEQLAKTDPRNTVWRYDLSTSYSKIGVVRFMQQDYPGALASFQSSLGILQDLSALDTSNANWQLDLAATLGRVGLAYQALDRLQDANDSLLKGRDILTNLAQRYPDWGSVTQNLKVLEQQLAVLKNLQK